jgi:hypothetical protein
MSCSWAPTTLGRQAVARLLPLQCRDRVPCRSQRRGRGLQAAPATLGAPHPYNAPPSSIATTSAWSTSPPILCSISVRSTWKSTYTSSARVSLPVTFGFSASPPRYSSPTSSPRDYCRVYSPTSIQSRHLYRIELRLQGGVEYLLGFWD